MRIQRIKLNIESMFLAVLGVYFFITVLNSSLLNLGFIETIYKWFALCVLSVLFIYHWWEFRFSLLELFLLVSLIFAFCIASFSTRRNTVIITLMFILCADLAPFKKRIKIHLIVTLLALVIVFLCIALGIIEDYRWRGAHCFGFSYIHYVPYYLYFCLVEHLYLKHKKMKMWEAIVWIAADYFLFLLSDVSLVFYLVIITVVLYLIIIRYPIININIRWVGNLSKFFYPAGAVVTYGIMVGYSRNIPILNKLNVILNGRIRLMNLGYMRYHLKLFGQYIDMEGNSVIRAAKNYFYIDSGFAYSILGYGLIFTGVVLVMYSILYVYSSRVNDKFLFVWLTSVLLFTLTNNIWVSINYNPVLLLTITAIKQLRNKQMVYRKRRGLEIARIEHLNLKYETH